MNSAEIARLAGVSRSTVSRVINGYENVHDETRQKVMKVIEENEYYPTLSGQLLAGKDTGILGTFWVSGTSSVEEIQNSVFFFHLAVAAASLGYLALTRIVNLNDEKDVQLVKEIFMQGRIDAGIFVGCKNNEPLIEELIAKGKIVGIFDHYHPDRTEPNRISVNFEQDVGVKVIDYLYKMGHRKIGVIDGNINNYCCLMRHDGFIKGMLKNGIEIRAEWMRYAGNEEDPGYIVARQMLDSCGDNLPTAICTINDSVAYGLYRALQEKGIAIPDQVSVIGIDDFEKSKLITPQLTTFAFDFQEIFYSLVDRTIKTVKQCENVPLTEFIPSKFIERDSVRDLNGDAMNTGSIHGVL